MKKNLIYLLIGLVTLSCQNTKQPDPPQIVPDAGQVAVKNGMGIFDTISYKCDGCQDIMTPDLFNELVGDVATQCQDILANPISFIPRELDIIVFQDSIYWWDTGELIDSVITGITNIKYIGKNKMGVDLGGEQRFLTRFVGGEIKDLSSKIRLDSLEFNEDIINRKLTGWTDQDYIEVIPTQKKSLIVKSSIGCIDEGTWLIIRLEGDNQVKLVSWNDFNCDGVSYYKWFNKSQIELLKSHKVESVSLIDDNSIGVLINENKGDYFQQLLKLYQ